MSDKSSSQHFAKKIDKQIAKMSFEESMARLEEIVEQISSQKIGLNEMTELFEEGKLLKEKCSKLLDEAKMRFEIVGQKEIE